MTTTDTKLTLNRDQFGDFHLSDGRPVPRDLVKSYGTNGIGVVEPGAPGRIRRWAIITGPGGQQLTAYAYSSQEYEKVHEGEIPEWLDAACPHTWVGFLPRDMSGTAGFTHEVGCILSEEASRVGSTSSFYCRSLVCHTATGEVASITARQERVVVSRELLVEATKRFAAQGEFPALRRWLQERFS